MRSRFEPAVTAAVRAAVAAHGWPTGVDVDIAIDRLVIDVPHGCTADGLGPLIARSVIARLEALVDRPPIGPEAKE